MLDSITSLRQQIKRQNRFSDAVLENDQEYLKSESQSLVMKLYALELFNKACIEGDLKTLSTLIQQSTVYEEFDSKKKCKQYIAQAITDGQVDVLKFLLNLEAIQNWYESNPHLIHTTLNTAIQFKQEESLDFLFHLRIFRNYCKESAQHFLKKAIKSKHLPSVSLLLTCNHFVKLLNSEPEIFVNLAAETTLEVFNLLLEYNGPRTFASTLNTHNHPLLTACSRYYSSNACIPDPEQRTLIVKSLLEIDQVRDNIGWNNNKAFRNAVKSGNFDIVRELLTFPEVRRTLKLMNNGKLLAQAAKTGHVELFQHLLKFPVLKEPLELWANRILCAGIKSGHFEMVRTLLQIPQIKEAVSDHNNKALWTSIRFLNSNIFLYLLSFNAVSNTLQATTVDTYTLHLDDISDAVDKGLLEIMNRLLDYPQFKTALGFTPSSDRNAILKECAKNAPLFKERMDQKRKTLHSELVAIDTLARVEPSLSKDLLLHIASFFEEFPRRNPQQVNEMDYLSSWFNRSLLFCKLSSLPRVTADLRDAVTYDVNKLSLSRILEHSRRN